MASFFRRFVMSENKENDISDGKVSSEDFGSRLRSSSSRSVSSLVRKLSYRSMSKKGNNGYTKGNFIPPHCKFKLVVQTVKPELTVCFMMAEMPGYALTCNKTEEVFAEKVINDIKFWERCSFIPAVNLWHDGFCAFESVREASRYLLFIDGRFYFKKYDGTAQFKKDASFLFSKQVPRTPSYVVVNQRRTQSSVLPPDYNNLKLPSKSRKFSLVNFRSNPQRNDDVAAQKSELQNMLPSGTLPFPDIVNKAQCRTEMYSLGLNRCYDCLTLTNYEYIQKLKEERQSPTISVNSSVCSSFNDAGPILE